MLGCGQSCRRVVLCVAPVCVCMRGLLVCVRAPREVRARKGGIGPYKSARVAK